MFLTFGSRVQSKKFSGCFLELTESRVFVAGSYQRVYNSLKPMTDPVCCYATDKLTPVVELVSDVAVDWSMQFGLTDLQHILNWETGRIHRDGNLVLVVTQFIWKERPFITKQANRSLT